MRDAVDYSARVAATRSPLERRGDFLWPTIPDFALTVRTPSAGDPMSERKPEHIPDEEIVLAMVHLTRDGGGIEAEALVSETARVFGIQRVGRLVGERLSDVLRRGIDSGELVEQDGRIRVT